MNTCVALGHVSPHKAPEPQSPCMPRAWFHVSESSKGRPRDVHQGHGFFRHQHGTNACGHMLRPGRAESQGICDGHMYSSRRSRDMWNLPDHETHYRSETSCPKLLENVHLDRITDTVNTCSCAFKLCKASPMTLVVFTTHEHTTEVWYTCWTHRFALFTTSDCSTRDAFCCDKKRETSSVGTTRLHTHNIILM